MRIEHRLALARQPQPFLTSAAFAACISLAAIVLMLACTVAGSPVETRPVADLKRQSAVIERELAARNEQELRVRVASVTTRILQGAGTVKRDEAGIIEAEVKAINTQLSSLKIPLLAPSLRFDPAEGRLVW